jgi:AraC family transcriptional regulator
VTLRIIERAPVSVVCLRYTGPLGEPLGRFWQTTVNPWLADLGLLDCPRYGVTLDNPLRTAPPLCRYDACVELPPGLMLEQAGNRTIAGGNYAVTSFKGDARTIGAAWDGLVGAVFASGVWRIDDTRLPFEHYPRRAWRDPRSGGFACELCVPLTN